MCNNFLETSLKTAGAVTKYVMYVCVANSDGSISMADGEELLVVESDQGDGWTLVRRRGVGGEEGFVPTSYIDIYLHR